MRQVTHHNPDKIPTFNSPEERLLSPLGDRDTPSPSSSCLSQLDALFDIAVRGELLSSADAARCLKILRLNPCERIARVGQRLMLLESVVQELHNIDARLTFAVETTRRELSMVEAVTKEWWGGEEG